MRPVQVAKSMHLQRQPAGFAYANLLAFLMIAIIRGRTTTSTMPSANNTAPQLQHNHPHLQHNQ